MSILQETPETQVDPTRRCSSAHASPISLEAHSVPATQSQRLAIEDALRFLAVWSVRAVSGAREPEDSS